MMNKAIKILIILVIILLGSIILISYLPIPGNYSILSVQSGSMEPAISMGSIVIIKPSKEYKINEIITIQDPANKSISVTHRIVDIINTDNTIGFVTKGDANESFDSEKRDIEDILGKVIIHIPYLGYVISFIKTSPGLLMTIIVPSLVIIISEINKIQIEINKIKLNRK